MGSTGSSSHSADDVVRLLLYTSQIAAWATRKKPEKPLGTSGSTSHNKTPSKQASQALQHSCHNEESFLAMLRTRVVKLLKSINDPESQFIEIIEFVNTFFDDLYLLTSLGLIKNEKISYFASSQASKAWLVTIIFSLKNNIQKISRCSRKLKLLEHEALLRSELLSVVVTNHKKKNQEQEDTSGSGILDMFQSFLVDESQVRQENIEYSRRLNIMNGETKEGDIFYSIDTRRQQLLHERYMLKLEVFSLLNDLLYCSIDVFNLKLPKYVQKTSGIISGVLSGYRLIRGSLVEQSPGNNVQVGSKN